MVQIATEDNVYVFKVSFLLHCCLAELIPQVSNLQTPESVPFTELGEQQVLMSYAQDHVLGMTSAEAQAGELRSSYMAL